MLKEVIVAAGKVAKNVKEARVHADMDSECVTRIDDIVTRFANSLGD